MSRPAIVGPDSGPVAPFPIRLRGAIVRGFGRGSRELGIPTANIPIAGATVGGNEVDSGIYYGWAGLDITGAATDDDDGTDAGGRQHQQQQVNGESTTATATSTTTTSTTANATAAATRNESSRGFTVYPMVVSIGYNPFYQNTVRSVEVHIMEDFGRDFYGARMNLSIMGFIRKERGYDSMEELVRDIRTDIEVGRRSLERERYVEFKRDPYLMDWEEEEGNEAGA